MFSKRLFSSIYINTAKALLSVNGKAIPDLNLIKKVLVVRQHNQFGDLLASVPLFRAIKETLPKSKLTVITSPQNYYAVTKNKYIDEQFIFDKKKLLNPDYLYRLLNLLRSGYDLVVVPVTVAISNTSCLLGRFARSDFRVGPAELNGTMNEYSFLFNYKVDMNWSASPERHVSDFGLDILRPLGIDTDNHKSEISYDEFDKKGADEFLSEINHEKNQIVIGMHIGAGKPPNRWPVEKFVSLSELICKDINAVFYLTGSTSDEEELNSFINSSKINCKLFLNRTIPEVAALISASDLFITNDTGIMHVAGATATPQISLFGPTNPNNWAPIGDGKIFVRNSNSINEISVDEVYENVKKLLST